jgi:phosphate transport system protein
MREAFEIQLAQLEQRIAGELEVAIVTLAEIADVVTDPGPDGPLAIAGNGRRLRDASRRADEELVILVARQAPVAGDLRLVLALMQLAHHQGLIANQFELISAQLAEADPGVLDRHGTGEKLSRMATLAGSQLASAADAFKHRDVVLARRLDRDDDAIDQLNREIFDATLELDGDPGRRELALRHILIARSLERIADNAVDIAEQAAYLATGQLREFSDASQPKPRPRKQRPPARPSTPTT